MIILACQSNAQEKEASLHHVRLYLQRLERRYENQYDLTTDKVVSGTVTEPSR